MSTITVPSGLSYMAASLASTIFLLTGQTYMVGRHRDLAGIQYPRLYADKEEMATSPAAMLFNCAQRTVLCSVLYCLPLTVINRNGRRTPEWTVLLGTKQPILAASGLGLWMTSRIAYTIGYLTGNPDNVRGPAHISNLN
ncbi:hypothetical protein FB451DRAFT_1360246 [Mycena latifolia]|nr:hypothetical protein FB451DRAFT_1360246 [Mycena latifolia]